MGTPRSFGVQLKALREAAGFTQEELATIAGLSVHAVSALERGERRRPHVDTVRALSAALDLTGPVRDALVRSARPPSPHAAVDAMRSDSLPLPPTALVGRESDLNMLRQWLADPAARLITLIGPGGVGKTRLALEVAREVAQGSTRVAFVPLAAIHNSAFVAPAIAESLGLTDVTAIDLPRRARAACADRPTLLVLDNFEHILDVAPLVADLLTSVTPLRLLLTSRAPLRVRGEREYGVGPLAMDPLASSPDDPASAPAIRLFLDRVRDVQPDFRLTATNGPTVTAICRRLDALPLALELAAPWVKLLTPQNLLHRLEHDILLSTSGPRDLPERQRTMNATVAWSYQLLDADEQRAFRRFGALPGLFPIDAAAAVLAGRSDGPTSNDDALRATAGLIDKSLLLRAESSVVATCPLYRMLETVRAYAALQLTASNDRDEAMEGLVRYCAGEASLAANELVGPGQVDWLDRVREDLESYRSALAWLIQHDRPGEASDIASALEHFWLIRGHATEGLQWHEQILSASSLPPVAELRTLVAAGMLWYSHGDLERARTALTRAITLGEELDYPQKLAQAHYLLGHVELAAGNLSTARDLFSSSLGRYRALATPSGIGGALTGLAWVALVTGDERVDRLLDEAAVALQGSGPWFLSLVRYLRAVLAVRRGRADEAIAVIRESLTQIRELRDKFAFVYALVPLAAAAVMKGDDAWAARILGARDTVTERTGAAIVDKSVNDLRQQAERDARARLGADHWARAYAAGRGTSVDTLLQDIDRIT